MMRYNFLCFLITVFLLSSCSTIGKILTGIHNPQFKTSLEDRDKYYSVFTDHLDSVLQIKHYVNQDTLINGFYRLVNQEMPILLAHQKDQNIYYALSCFEDISSDVEDLNNHKYDELVVAQDSTISLVLQYINETVVDERLTPNYKPDLDKNLEVYYVGGIFLGNKIRKRISAIAKIQNLRSLQIVELSMPKDDE